MAQVYAVTASTSVVLVNTVGTPNTIVYLSSIRYPGHLVGIRDTTGSPLLTTQPIIVSTVEGIKFYDGTTSTLITQPFGSLTVASKDPTTWQILNSVGFFTTLSNAYVSSLTATTGTVSLLSSVQEFTSSSVIGRVTITKSIDLGGTTQIVGDITVGGTVDFFSTLEVFGRLTLSSLMFANDTVTGLSSVTIGGDLQVGGTLSTLNDLRVGRTLTVGGEAFADGATLSKLLSVQTLQTTSLDLAGGLQAAGFLSTGSTLRIGSFLQILSTSVLQSTVTIGGGLAVSTQLTTHSSVQTQIFSTAGSAVVRSEVSVRGSTEILQTLSTSASMNIRRGVGVDGLTYGGGDVTVEGLSRFRVLTVAGPATVSSLHVVSSLRVGGDALSYGSNFTTRQDLIVLSTVGIGGPLLAPTVHAQIQGSASTLQTLGIGTSLDVGGSLTVGGSTLVGTTLLGISSFRSEGSISTGSLTAQGRLDVMNFFSTGTLGASTLGAPIDLNISSLTLSNTLFVSAEGRVPLFETTAYPQKLFVGPAPPESAEVNVDGVLRTHSTLNQTTLQDYSKLWTIVEGQTSTLLMTTLLSTSILGDTTVVKPSLTNRGSVLTGSFGANPNLFCSSNLSSSYITATTSFLGPSGGAKVAFGNGLWVTVGSPSSPAAPQQSILTSPSGYTWSTAVSGGFPFGGTDVLYAGGRWLATGCNTGAGPTIQQSLTGTSWSATIGSFNAATGGYGAALAYNGSNLWVSAGSNPGLTGLKYSGTGGTWSNATLIPPIPFVGAGVGFGGGRWVASDGISQLVTSTDGQTWLLLGQPLGKTRFVYNGSLWVAGGPATSGNPLTSIHVSPTGVTWIPITSGGFTDRCTDVVWDPEALVWYATGVTQPPTQTILLTSGDGLNWTPIFLPSGIGRANGLGIGTLQMPDTDSYFTVNLTTRMNTLLSSFLLTASTVKVSSIESSAFFGDGQGLSNVVSFRPSVNASSFFAKDAYTLTISTQRFQSEFVRVADTVTVRENPFTSSVNLWIAVGGDSEPTGNTQTSFTGFSWIRGLSTSFEFYGKSIAGNCNLNNPLYVAAGGDSRTDHTLQWSTDGRTWSPISEGGFWVAEGGVKQGNSVAYNATVGRWVAAGNALGTESTLLHSVDGLTWFPGSNAFSNAATFVAAGPTGYLALGPTGVKYSGDGILWSNSVTPVQFDTVGYGQVTVGPLTVNGWMGTSNLTTYESQTGGILWDPLGTSLKKITSVTYGGGLWVGVGCNRIQYSSNAVSWSGVTTAFGEDTIFNTVAYNSNQGRWVAGALSTTAERSLWSSSNLLDWIPAQSGGFSTTVLAAAAGYGVFTSSLYTFVAGKASFNGVTPLSQTILAVSTTGAGSYLTSNSLTQSNASNVFESEVRAIYGCATQPYRYVAVGDGETPQKTIGRSQTGEANTWIPAITGGFSTTGYGLTHYDGLWFAVGDTQASTNTIQYSADGANWFGTNSGLALRSGGRGIGVGVGALFSTLVAVGRDPGNSTITTSQRGSVWTPTLGSYFTPQGNAVAGGDYGFVAVGTDSRGSASTILQSADGSFWTNTFTGGFSGGGFGVAYGGGSYVAVGADAAINKTIQYSTDGGTSFFPSLTGGFTVAGYGVAYNPTSNLFFAVGQDLGTFRNATVKYSGDAMNWSNISSLAGFQSQTILGAGYSVFTQPVLITEKIPYLEFSNLIVYDRSEPLLYPVPTVRVQSSFVMFNESLMMTLSSQMIIRGATPYSASTVLTVYGDIYASSFLYTGTVPASDTLVVSSLVVSTLSSIVTLEADFLTTPSLAFNAPDSKANLISSFQTTVFSYPTNLSLTVNALGINETLFVTSGLPFAQQIGIGTATPSYELVVKGAFATSTLSTSYVFGLSSFQATAPEGPSLQDPLFSLITTQTEAKAVSGQNTLVATPSSLTFNSVLSVTPSTQCVGVYTQTPAFTLDVKAKGVLQILSTPQVTTSLLFLTLQSA